MNNYTEAVARAKKGEQDAFAYLYEQTYTRCFYLARKMLNNEYTAQDIVQDSYVKAFNSLDQLEDAAKFQSWLLTIVNNRCKNELKRRKETLFSDTENEDGQDISDTFEDDRIDTQPDLQMDQNETKRLMQEIIDTLSDEQRICITMFYMEEMSVKEMAAALEVSENTVKSRLNYGRQKIKDKVLDLEKKGTKLYGLAPIPFFLLLLKEDVKAAQYTIPPMSEAAISSATSSSVTSVGGKIAGHAASVAGKGVTTKIVAGVVAGVLVVGGGAAAAVHMNGTDNGMKTVKKESQLPDWAKETVGIGLKYVNIQGYKYPLMLDSEYNEDNEKTVTLFYKSDHSGAGYSGMKGNDEKTVYFGEYNGIIYYAYESAIDITENPNANRYHLYRLPDAEHYNMFAEDMDTYTNALLNYIDCYYDSNNPKEQFPYDEQKAEEFESIKEMINMDGYSFDEWYTVSESSFFDNAVDAYNDYVVNGEEEANAISASHITLIDLEPETEIDEPTENMEPTETGSIVETEKTETNVETDEPVSDAQAKSIPVPNYAPSDLSWNVAGTYTSSDGRTLYLSMFTDDGGVPGWVGNIDGGSLPGTLEVFYDNKIYYLRTGNSSYTSFTDSGYAFTLEPTGETIDYYGSTYEKLLLKLYYNGELQGEYYEVELYQS